MWRDLPFSGLHMDHAAEADKEGGSLPQCRNAEVGESEEVSFSDGPPGCRPFKELQGRNPEFQSVL
jgi:hypothetical protein